jgi:hypothetical protein
MQNSKSKVTKFEWLALYVITGIIDLAQIAVSLTGIGIAFSEAAEPVIGIFLIGYFQLRGVSMIKHPSRLISLLGVAGFEVFTGGIAPAWIVDVWIIHKTVRNEEAGIQTEETTNELLMNEIRKPLYKNGIRLPQTNNTALPPVLNVDGIRPPNGGLK